MAKDIMLDENNDIDITGGDFRTGESQMQEVYLILQTAKGEWKENPLVGANLVTEIRSEKNEVKREREIRIQMQIDGKNYDEIKKNIKQQ